MTFQEFLTKYPNIRRTNFLMYEGIANSIRTFGLKCGIQFSKSSKILETKVWHTIAKGNKHIQSLLLKSEATPTATERWNAKYNQIFNWKKIFQLNINTTSDIQLRWFQMRVLHRLIPTEKYLHTCKIVDTPLCTFCQTETQTIEHLFWHCPIVKTFWTALCNLIKEKCTHAQNLTFNEILIIFGANDQTVTDGGLDKIILWAKFYVYKSKMEKVLPNLNTFIPVLKYRLNTEKYLAKIKGTEGKHNLVWAPYQPLIDQL